MIPALPILTACVALGFFPGVLLGLYWRGF